MNIAFYSILALLLTVAVLLVLLILIQKGRGGGLSGAFGGSGGSTAFGAKTGDVLTWATSVVFGVFILLAVVLDLIVNHQYAKPAVAAAPPAAVGATTSVPAESSVVPPAVPAAVIPPVVPTTRPAGAVSVPALRMPAGAIGPRRRPPDRSP